MDVSMFLLTVNGITRWLLHYLLKVNRRFIPSCIGESLRVLFMKQQVRLPEEYRTCKMF